MSAGISPRWIEWSRRRAGWAQRARLAPVSVKIGARWPARTRLPSVAADPYEFPVLCVAAQNRT